MTRTDRRSFLVTTGSALALSTLGLSGCSRRPPTRAEVLAGLVERIAAPDLQRVMHESASLERAIQDLGDALNPGAIDEAREALRRAILAWQRTYAFRQGPIVDSYALLRATFWPARPAAIAAQIQGTQPIDAALVAELGVDVKGLFALEHLLFEGPGPGSLWLSGTDRARVLSMLRALSADVLGLAQSAERAFGDGSAFAKKLAAGGQESLNRLVNELVATVETTAISHLGPVLAMGRDGVLKPREVQGSASGLSAAILRTWIEVCGELYEKDGHGLSELVRVGAPDLDGRVRGAFERATSALRSLDAPLERIAQKEPPRLERVVKVLKELEAVIKADLASALGVTLTFTSGDGD